ncbi:hypothetical protein [Kitasatospora sp. NPDC101183]|uniref:hypothetical protein n=1 Tax=Kitasatospora sp. NPDC101183 TaxID=3364100 RepID=UPI003804E72E
MNDSPTAGATVHLVEPDGAAGPPLGHGFLAGPATVLVPDPPQALGDPWQRYLVRIGAETVRVAGVSLAAVSADGIRTAAAVLALVEPSVQADQATVGTTLAALTDSLRRHQGDLWSSYQALGFPVAAPGNSGSQPETDGWWISHAAHDLVVFAAGICCVTTNCGGCGKS